MPTDNRATQSPERLAALKSTGLLDAPAEPAFDLLTKLVTSALRVPVALISLVDKDRQFFTSQCGLPTDVAAARQTPLSHSFCQHVVNRDEPLIVTDARFHDLVKANLAVLDLNVLAYAGVPIHDEDGYVLGSICAIDFKPRQWADSDIELLRALSAQVTQEIRLRNQTIKLAKDLEFQRGVNADRQTMAKLDVHDLRTPLAALVLGIEIIGHLGPVNERQKSYLALCKRNAKALQDIVDNMLDITSIGQRAEKVLSHSQCTPGDIVARASEQVGAIAGEKTIRIRVDVEDTLPALSADVDKVVRVLVNLVANAIKFSPPDSKVTVSAALTDQMIERSAIVEPPRAATLAGDALGDVRKFVRFSVEDNGVGIASTEDIFKEGVRVDREAVTRRSTGLGLTFCKRVVEAHGGAIWYDTIVGSGSTFYFTIPVD